MKLKDRVELVNDLIRENPDVKIRDYIEILRELERIEETIKPKPVEGSKLNRHSIPSIRKRK